MGSVNKIIFTILILIVSLLCVLSLAVLIYVSVLLDIDKKLLKKGVFDISEKTLEFTLDKLRNCSYDIVLRAYYPKPRTKDFDMFKHRTISDNGKYAVDIDIMDFNGTIIQHEKLLPNSGRTKSWGADYFELYLADFKGNRSQKYVATVTFHSEEKYFDELNKEIYIEQFYDHAAIPFWRLLQLFSFLFCVVTTIILLVISVIYWRNKKRLRDTQAIGTTGGT